MLQQDSATSAFQLLDSLSTDVSTSHLPYTVITTVRPLDLTQLPGFHTTSNYVRLE
jgi:hypothetical protein